MSKSKSKPVPVAAPCWYFRDRSGHKMGPYTDVDAIYAFLRKHLVSHNFKRVQPENAWDIRNNDPEFIMEDSEWRPVQVDQWLKQYYRNRDACLVSDNWYSQYHRHVHRRGPVSHITNGRYRGRYKSIKQARLMRDTVNVYAEDMEPPIRAKCRLNIARWGDEAHRCVQRSWKSHRRHQWVS